MLSNGCWMRYSPAVPNRPDEYRVRVFTPAFFRAGTTSLFCKSSHSFAMSGFTCVMVTRDRLDVVCATQGAERQVASARAPATLGRVMVMWNSLVRLLSGR